MPLFRDVTSAHTSAGGWSRIDQVAGRVPPNLFREVLYPISIIIHYQVSIVTVVGKSE